MGATNDLLHLLRIYWSLMLGNIVEWYEFAVYGYLAPYLEANLFQHSTICTWLGFTVTFLARPFGGMILGIASDVVGRNRAVSVSIVGMMIGTCCQGMLPTYDNGTVSGHIGIVFLVFLRLLQGICAAGEISTISTYITEVSSPTTIGRSIAMVAITGNLGFLSAKGVVFCVTAWLGEDVMSSWGWRLPFLLAAIPSCIATVGRRWLPESREFLDQKAQAEANKIDDNPTVTEGNPEATAEKESTEESAEDFEDKPSNEMKRWRPSIREILRTYSHNVIIGIFGAASFGVCNYAGCVWMQSYLRKNGLSPAGCMVVELASRGTMLVLAIPAGWITDKRGVGWTTLVGAVLVSITALPLFTVVSADPTNLATVLMALVALAILNMLGGTVYFFFVTELFPTAIRGAAVGVTYNIGVSLFGGLAPVLTEASLALHPQGPGMIISLSGIITTVTLVIAIFLQHRGVTKLTHVRRVPYFPPLDDAQGVVEDKSSPDANPNVVPAV